MTKEIRLRGKKYRLTLDEIHKINLIKRGVQLQERIEPLKKELTDLKEELAGMAVALKGDGRMVRLDGIIGEATLEWKRVILVDPERADALRAKLGGEFIL